MTQTCTDSNSVALAGGGPVRALAPAARLRADVRPVRPGAGRQAEAAALVLEYLIDRPEDAAGQALLLRHACEVGGVYALGS